MIPSWSRVLAACRAREAQAPDLLRTCVAAYRAPLLWTVRARGLPGSVDALLGRPPDPGSPRLRTYLAAALDNAGSEDHTVVLESEESPIAPGSVPPDRVFDLAWSLHLLREAALELRSLYLSTGGEARWGAFERYYFQGAGSRTDPQLAIARVAAAEILRNRVAATVAEESLVADELRALRTALV